METMYIIMLDYILNWKKNNTSAWYEDIKPIKG